MNKKYKDLQTLSHDLSSIIKQIGETGIAYFLDYLDLKKEQLNCGYTFEKNDKSVMLEFVLRDGCIYIKKDDTLHEISLEDTSLLYQYLSSLSIK